ncbi:MAG: hypothetical protein Kow0074_00400 [Candidatus Zixiibacteriota bacterium]
MRKRFKIPLITILAVLLAVVVVAVWMVRSGWLTRRAADLVNSRIPTDVKLSVSMGRLTGNVFHRFGIDGIVVTTRRGQDTVVTIDHLVAEYDWRQLWRGEWDFSMITMASLRLYVPRDSIITYVESFLPERASESVGKAAILDVSVDTFHVTDGRVLSRSDHSAIIDSLDFHASVEVKENDIDARVWEGELHEPTLGRTRFSGHFALMPDSWLADSVVLITESSHLTARGNASRWFVRAHPIEFSDLGILVKQLPQATLDFDGEITPPRDGLWYFAGVTSGSIGQFQLQDVSLGFSVKGSQLAFDSIGGRIQGAYWRGSADLDAGPSPIEYRYTGDVDGFDLAQWVTEGIPSDLSGHVSLSGRGLADPELDLALDVDLTPGSFNRIEFDRAIGRMRVTLEDVRFEDNFILQWGANQFEGNGRVVYDDSLDIFGNVYSDDLSTWRRVIGVDSLGGRSSGYVYISGETQDPDLAGRLLSDSLVLEEIVTRDLAASIYVPKFLTQRKGTITAELGRTTVGTIDVDSAYIRAELDSSALIFDSIMAATPALVIRGRGSFDWSHDHKPLLFYPLDLTWEDDEFSVGDTVALFLDSTGIDLDLLSVNSTFGYFEATGRYWYNDSIDFILGVEGFPIAPVWRRFLPGTELAGEFGCTGLLQGTVSEPVVELDVEFSSLQYDNFRPGTISGEVFYSGGMLRTERLTLTRRRMEAIFSGVLPLDFSIDPPRFELLDEPMEGYLTASGEALPVAYFLPETVEYMRGPFSVSAAMSGTIRSPRFNGNMYLRSGELKAVEIVSPIEDLNADIVLIQDTIRIERAHGVVRDEDREGEVSATGTLRLLSYTTFDYNIDVIGRDVPARFEFEDYYVETDFDLKVVGVTPPLVRGTITPIRVEDRTDFEDELGPGTIDTTVWDWDLAIVMPGNYWIHNDQINAELSADMRLLREKGEITYLGTAEIIRGQVYLFDKTGRISRGVLSFNNKGEPDPELDIDVTFRIRQPRPDAAFATEGTQVEDLNLHVGGTASEPIIDLLDPNTGYTEQDVLLLLTTNSRFDAAGGDLTQDPWADRLRFAATGLLLTEVQRVAARKLGLETLEISSGGAADNTEVTVGRYFTPSLYLYGTSPIDVGGGQEVGFEYRFNRNIYLEGSRNRANLYRLNIHFTWDY